MRITRSIVVPAAGLYAFCAAAHAQPNDDKVAEPATEIQEIIVTAQKREQSINDVGETIAAIGSASLAAQRLSDLDSIARAVPGLQFTPSNTNTPVLTLRGVGFYDNSLAAAPAVTVYLDEVALPFPVLSSLTAFDLERIEVLKGPQGTLFGENSTGGALNYIAAKPTDRLKMGASAGVGRFSSFETNAYISGPVSDTLKLRLAVRSMHEGDWLESATRHDKTGSGDTVAARFLADWAPSDGVKLSLNVNGWHAGIPPAPGQYLFPNPQQSTAGAGFPFATFPRAPGSPLKTDWPQQYPPHADNNFGQAALRGDIKLQDDLTLTAISSYIHYRMASRVCRKCGPMLCSATSSSAWPRASRCRLECAIPNPSTLLQTAVMIWVTVSSMACLIFWAPSLPVILQRQKFSLASVTSSVLRRAMFPGRRSTIV